MEYVNQYDTLKECSKNGYKAEALFKLLAEQRGYTVSLTSQEENIYKHIDLKLSIYDKSSNANQIITVDVKSRKKTNRKDSSVNDDWTWIEYRNVQGEKGWILGEATHIAFERAEDFIIFPRQRLARWTKNNLKELGYPFAKNASDSRYKLYRRDGRLDLITQIKISEASNEIQGVKIWTK